MKDHICAIILTYNEELNVRRCLESIKGMCEIFVVDSGSTDRTVEICKEYTNKIFFHEYVNHAAQWQWAIDHLPISSEWLLALDADFIVTDSLKQQILDELPTLAKDIEGVYVLHRYMFGGSLIRFGGTKKYWLRIVRRGCAKVDLSDLVDFRFLVSGRTLEFKGVILEDNFHDRDISSWIKKQDKFAIRLAVEEELRRARLLTWEKKPSYFGNSDDRFMWLRDRWLALPLFIRPLIYFIYRYLLRLGFLDGKGGFLYHVLQGFWLRLMVDWKIDQIRKLGLTENELVRFRDKMLTVKEGSVTQIYTSLKEDTV